jgi:hypothetical protein
MKKKLQTIFIIVLFFIISPFRLNGEESAVQKTDEDYPLVNVKEYEDKLKQDKNLPFNKTWIDYINLKKYNKIIIAEAVPGRGGQNQNSESQKNNTQKLSGQAEQDLKDFVKYTREAFQRAVQNNVDFDLVAQPGPKTLALKLYLVNVITAKPLLDAARHSDGMSATSPAAAIEGVLEDSQSGKTVLVFADRQSAKTESPGINDSAAYGSLRQIVDEWAELFVKVLNSQKGEEIKRRGAIKIIDL